MTLAYVLITGNGHGIYRKTDNVKDGLIKSVIPAKAGIQSLQIQ